MQTAELFLQEGWGHWIIVVEVFLFLSDAQLFVFTAPFQARDLMMDFCKSDWHFQHLKGNFLLSVTQTPSHQTSNFFIVVSTRQIHLCPCPFPSTFTYIFIAPGGHKILPPALRCLSKLEQGRSVRVLASEHLWNCWYGALERSWLWPQRLHKAQHWLSYLRQALSNRVPTCINWNQKWVIQSVEINGFFQLVWLTCTVYITFIYLPSTNQVPFQ